MISTSWGKTAPVSWTSGLFRNSGGVDPVDTGGRKLFKDGLIGSSVEDINGWADGRGCDGAKDSSAEFKTASSLCSNSSSINGMSAPKDGPELWGRLKDGTESRGRPKAPSITFFMVRISPSI